MFRFFFDGAWGGFFWIEKLCFDWFRKGGLNLCSNTSKWTPMIENIGISSQYNSVTNTVTLHRILPSCSRRYRITTNPARKATVSAAHRWTSDLCRRCVHCTHVTAAHGFHFSQEPVPLFVQLTTAPGIRAILAPAFGVQPRQLGSACDSTCPVTSPCFCQNSYPSRSANNDIAFEGERSWDSDLETRAAQAWHRSGLSLGLYPNSRPVPVTMFLFSLGHRLDVGYMNVLGRLFH